MESWATLDRAVCANRGVQRQDTTKGTLSEETPSSHQSPDSVAFSVCQRFGSLVGMSHLLLMGILGPTFLP